MSAFIFVLLLTACQGYEYEITVDLNTVISNIPTPFYGFTIDWWTPNDPTYGKKWGNAGVLSVDFSNEDFIALTREISPAILRIGGSPQDSIIYNISGACLNINASLPDYTCSQVPNNYGCLNISRWQQIIDFAYNTNTSLIFGLNACYARPTNDTSMNFTNIKSLFDVTVNKLKNTDNLFGFELGNELGQHIISSTYAQDFYTLSQLINTYFHTNKPYLMGPDVANHVYIQDVIKDLQNLTNEDNISYVLHALTYHNYPDCKYPNGNVSVFDLNCLENIVSTGNLLANIAATGSTMAYMGEGSEHGGGGTPNVSNTFVDCFYYLYQLSEILSTDNKGTMRSDLVGGDYELIDHKTFIANPDYWILYLFKMFVKDKVYKSYIFNSTIGNFRGYALNGDLNNVKGEICLILINFDLNNNATVTWNIQNGSTSYYSDIYHLKTATNTLQSRVIEVNGVNMVYENGHFPVVRGIGSTGKFVVLEPATIAFVILAPM